MKLKRLNFERIIEFLFVLCKTLVANLSLYLCRAFGVLKQRWRIIDHLRRIIDHTGGRLCYTPLKACKITMCCFILHNICRRHNIPVPHIEPSPASCLTTAERPEEGTGVHDQQIGNTVREAIISSFQ